MQWLKNKFDTTTLGTLTIVAAVSFVGACIYVGLNWLGFWNAFVGILVMAGAIYTYILQRFEK